MKHPMKRLVTFGLLALCVVGAAAAAIVLPNLSSEQSSTASAAYDDIAWDDLVPSTAFDFLDRAYENQELWDDPEFLKQLDEADRLTVAEMNGREVTLPGFMVPLEFKGDKVTNFLMVPQAAACIHVPPPPPNQTILAKALKPVRQRDLYTPILIKGKVFVGQEDTELAETSYYFEVTAIEDFEEDWIPPGHENVEWNIVEDDGSTSPLPLEDDWQPPPGWENNLDWNRPLTEEEILSELNSGFDPNFVPAFDPSFGQQSEPETNNANPD